MIELAEALERLEAMPEFVEVALSSVSAEQAAYRPKAGGFSLLEQACHLRDLEREGYLLRVHRILNEHRPELAGFDGAAVAAQRDYLREKPEVAAREFAAAREEVLRLLQPLSEPKLDREAIFGGETITLGKLVAMMVEHDQGHRAEIEALMDEIEGR